MQKPKQVFLGQKISTNEDSASASTNFGLHWVGTVLRTVLVSVFPFLI